jgi:hypothetical protein
MYRDLASLREGVGALGDQIRCTGIPAGVGPLVVAFVGSGKVSQGA